VTESLLLEVLPGATHSSGLTADLSNFKENPFDDLFNVFHKDLRDDLAAVKEKEETKKNDRNELDLLVEVLPLKDYLEKKSDNDYENSVVFDTSQEQNDVLERYLNEFAMPPLSPLPSLQELSKW